MDRNRIRALHPKMFSHLAHLDRLDLRRNPCVDEEFRDNPSKAAIERELAACGARYELQEKLEFSGTQSLDKMNEKFKLIKLFDRSQELQALNNAKLKERLEENAKEVKIIKRRLGNFE